MTSPILVPIINSQLYCTYSCQLLGWKLYLLLDVRSTVLDFGYSLFDQNELNTFDSVKFNLRLLNLLSQHPLFNISF